jgi:C-terminal processing protease CtpA/Prc
MDNGGGSMDEAMKLAGMFIDSGPLYGMQTQNDPIQE